YSDDSLDELHPLNWVVYEVEPGKYCSELVQPFPEEIPNLFPIVRDSSWEGETFIKSQGAGTIFIFYFAVLLYLILLVPNTIALIHSVIDFRHDVKAIQEDQDSKVRRIFLSFFNVSRIIHFAIELILIRTYHKIF